MKNPQVKAPAAKVGFVGWETAYDSHRQEVACQECYCDLVAELAEDAVRISLSDQELFQFLHEIGPTEEILLLQNKMVISFGNIS